MEGRDDDCSKCHPSRLRNLFRAGVRTGSREIQTETSDSMRAPIPDVPKGMGDCEVRLSLTLLKVLPVKVRQPVLERQGWSRSEVGTASGVPFMRRGSRRKGRDYIIAKVLAVCP